MTRFWIKFDLPEPTFSPIGLGCGVTAYDFDDALQILRGTLFAEETMPGIAEVIENVDMSTLDEGHVLPNTRSIFVRGMWFPAGYEIIE